MKITNVVRFATFSMFLASGSLALADTPPAQNHHCKLPDGSMDMKKTHKQCDTAKGEWAKDADAPKPTTPATAKDAGAPKDATKPTTPAKDATPPKDTVKPTTPTKDATPPVKTPPPAPTPAPTPAKDGTPKPATH